MTSLSNDSPAISLVFLSRFCSLSQASLVILEFLQIRTQASEMPCILRLNLVSATYQLWYYNTSLAPSTTISRLDYCSNLMTEPVHSKGDHSWVFFGMNDAKAETPVLWPPCVTHWKKLWWWEGLEAGGEGDDRGWAGWMASPTRWMWVWVNSGSWWWTGRPGMLWFMGLQRVGHERLNWTELRWTELCDAREMLTNALVVIVLCYISIQNQRFVYTKLIQWYLSIISQIWKRF